MNSIYPWQEEQWRQLQERDNQARLPHALLFAGMRGIGKFDFAVALSKALLCAQPIVTGEACGACKSCLLFTTDNHPDYKPIVPEDTGGVIKIDQIRELISWLGLHSHFGGKRIVLLAPADAMNAAAANALLKTLEEPQPNTLLLLLTDRPHRLPATIRSRCQTLRFALPRKESALDWLRDGLVHPAQAENLLGLAGGAPLTAKHYGEDGTPVQQQQRLTELERLADGRLDPVAVAADWAKDESGQPLLWLYQWVSDMIRSRTGTADFAHNMELASTLQSLANRIDLQRLYSYFDKVAEGLRLQQTSVNKRLMLEGLLISWTSIRRDPA
ncbi:MAG: DNA polymerase III subunit delta' [Gammaproteobacteria bacterium]|nr:DNA polymerase III subunit delta' [Gammaproteobacteria bacterium]MDH5652684.1 DNA polymerase III subunit delta' [Gammaproteobacteria bacterium]